MRMGTLCTDEAAVASLLTERHEELTDLIEAQPDTGRRMADSHPARRIGLRWLLSSLEVSI